MGKGFKMNRPKDSFSKKQQARVIEHVSVKPNEMRKKMSLLQMQRGKVIKYRHSLFGRPYRIVDYLLLAGLV